MNQRSTTDHYFLALWPDIAARDAIAEAADRWLHDTQRRCRRIRMQRYHLTLLFLGAIAPDAGPALARFEEQLDSLVWAPFRMVLDRYGHFGSRVGWLGCREPPMVLLDLHERVRQAAREAGLSTNSSSTSFVPHVTVARDASAAWPLAADIELQISWEVRDYVLMRSQVSEGHAYREIRHFPSQIR